MTGTFQAEWGSLWPENAFSATKYAQLVIINLLYTCLHASIMWSALFFTLVVEQEGDQQGQVECRSVD